ncbi:tetratricopeptide repeat protein [Pseudomonas stutzeri]|uniref:tetratricopeptide repeat protein n=1 Tax=Stutzerimonas stutzeri TaxID=316 RepID=UPI00210E5A94|nr:tetratricopeptide repeat protein [Stutzerimonas stutzeri]MCQ4311457.1 tetratricopeptide repeat protein [Stutzerimonas stutzeri]
MRNYAATESARLLSPWTMLLVVVLVGGVLVWTYAGEDVFMPGEKRPDAVSINYAELLLEAHPDDTDLRRKLVEQLIELGDYARARSHVFQLAASEAGSVRFYLMELAILEATANPDGISDQARKRLLDQLRGVESGTLSIDQLVRQAGYALALSAPRLAAPIYRDLAKRDVPKRAYWLGEAARAHLAAGEPLLAAQIFTGLISTAQTRAEKHQYLQQAFSALRSADRAEQAAELIHRNLTLLTEADGALFGSAAQAAVGSQRFDLASETVARWRTLAPDDVAAFNVEFDLRLAAGEIDEAWLIGQRLATIGPLNAARLEQLAQLGEWTGHSAQALDFWLRLVETDDRPAIREHTWRLAAQLFDFDHTVALLAALSEQRRLSDAELEALVYSHQARGTPSEAERWLRGYLQLHPDHQLAWLRLQLVLEQTQQLAAQAELWAEIERRFGLNVDQRVSWARVNWELFDPKGAWQVLNDLDADAVTDEAYWHLRAELAWELERNADALDSYRRLETLGVDLDDTGEERLIRLYSRSSPATALDVMIASWQRNRTPANLSRALQLAEDLDDMARLEVLVAEGQRMPDSRSVAALWSARALLAERAGNSAEAGRLYRQALIRFPRSNRFREQLLWHYIDHNQADALVPLLAQWRPLATGSSRLWLPFASASLLLNRNDEALRWFDLYLHANPNDWLVQAAYADVLDSTGYSDRALRLRRHLLGTSQMHTAAANPARYQTYLRLLSNSWSTRLATEQALRWRDGSRPMLQLWFEQFSAQLDALGQTAAKGEWISWGRRNGLRINQYAELQQALQANNRGLLERLLAQDGLDPAQRVEALMRLGGTGQPLAKSLAALSAEQPAAIRQQLLRQSLALQESRPQGFQFGMRQQDFGTIRFQGETARIARQVDADWHAQLSLARLDYSGTGLLGTRPGVEQTTELELTRTLANGALGVALDRSQHDEGERRGASVSRSLQLGDSDALELQFDWHRQAEESGLLRALGRRDALSINGRHGISARDQLSWSLAHQRFSTLDGEAVGNGHQFNLELSHAVFFEGPSWTLRSGLSYSRYSQAGELSSIQTNGPEPALAADLLQDRFGQLYVGSTWRRGFPGALNQGTAQYSWLLDLLAGWQWTEQQPNYAITTGVGMRVLGDDELAFTFGFQSAPRSGDGEPGGTLGMTYSARFGR